MSSWGFVLSQSNQQLLHGRFVRWSFFELTITIKPTVVCSTSFCSCFHNNPHTFNASPTLINNDNSKYARWSALCARKPFKCTNAECTCLLVSEGWKGVYCRYISAENWSIILQQYRRRKGTRTQIVVALLERDLLDQIFNTGRAPRRRSLLLLVSNFATRWNKARKAKPYCCSTFASRW